jgi:DNA-directed RNA polymerase alpha subunit
MNHKPPTAAQRAAEISVMNSGYDALTRGRLFHDRDFTKRTVEALVVAGIDAPERLLFATEAELKKLPGIGKAGLGEIMRYRARYLREELS